MRREAALLGHRTLNAVVTSAALGVRLGVGLPAYTGVGIVASDGDVDVLVA